MTEDKFGGGGRDMRRPSIYNVQCQRQMSQPVLSTTVEFKKRGVLNLTNAVQRIRQKMGDESASPSQQ